MIIASSDIGATSSATRVCSAGLYMTTGGQTLGGVSEPTPAQALKKRIAITRAAAGSIEHLFLNGIIALQLVQPLGGATGALTAAAEV